MGAGIAIFVTGLALLSVGALALQVYRLSGRLKKLEKAREVERRHREHLTAQVERLEDRTDGASAEREGEGDVRQTVRPRFLQ